MRKLTYLIASTLDGFIAGPDGTDPTGPGGFWPIGEDYIARIIAEYPETLPATARDALGVTDRGTHFDTVLEGRGSYETGLAAGVTDAYPHLRHLVFSRTLGSSPDPAVELVATDPVERVRALRNEPGAGLWLVGGGELAGSLYAEIDELVLKLSPVTIGAGVPLFGRSGPSFQPTAWTHVDTTTLPSGVAFHTFRR